MFCENESCGLCQEAIALAITKEVARSKDAPESAVTSTNKQSVSLSTCCKEFVNSEYQYCPWCGKHVPGHYDTRLSNVGRNER